MNFRSIPFDSLLVPSNLPLRECIERLDLTARQILFVHNNQKKIVGTLNDGDVRRAILTNKGLETTAYEVSNHDFFYAKEGDSETLLASACSEKGIRHVPVLDSSNCIVNLLVIEESLRLRHHHPVVIMAGGLGTRLGDVTKTCPKPMIPINGKPILHIVLESFICSGFSEFYITVNYLKEQIIDYFGDGSRFGVEINYVIEDKPLGTAGSLALLRGKVISSFVLVNADVLSTVDFSSILDSHLSSNASATIVVREDSRRLPFGVVKEENGFVTDIFEKPVIKSLVNAGVYVFNSSALDMVPDSTFYDAPSLILDLINDGQQVKCFPLYEYWIDVGRPESLSQATSDWIE